MKSTAILFLLAVLSVNVTGLEFVIGLRQRNLDQLRDTVLDISDPLSANYGQYLSVDQINSMIGYERHEVQPFIDHLMGSTKTTNEVYEAMEFRGDAIYVRVKDDTMLGQFLAIQNLDIPTEFKDMVEFVEYKRPATKNETQAIRRAVMGNQNSRHLKKVNNVYHNMVQKERALYKNFKEISNNCSQAGIPNNVTNNAQVLYKQAYDKQKQKKKGNRGSRSDNLDGIKAACIYYSCKLYGINRSHEEVAEICHIDEKVVSRGCKQLFNLLNREVQLNRNTTNYSDFLERYAYYLKLNAKESKIVRDTCENVYDLELLEDCKPWTVASTCMYFASIVYNFGLERQDIAEKCNISEGTLERQFKILLEKADEILV